MYEIQIDDLRAIGKGRPRTGRYGIYTPPKTRAFETALQAIVRGDMQKRGITPFPAETPLAMVIQAFYAMPKSWSKKKRSEYNGKPYTNKPDYDNAAKAITDALNGVLYDDDRQIFYGFIVQRWAYTDKIEITVAEEIGTKEE